jgi:ADP-ribose pyrophosphatase YjhB (NUDIX family)
MTMKFCMACGSQLELKVPPGDNRERHVCITCGEIHYQNPKIVTGCIPVWEDKVLLCKRAIEPRYGLWTVPAGFMENGESTHAGAMRETLEEANARVVIDELYITVNLPLINQVYMLFRAQLLDLDFSAGEESLDVRLFSEDEIPWEELAFPTVEISLKRFFSDRARGEFTPGMVDIVRDAEAPKGYLVTEIA